MHREAELNLVCRVKWDGKKGIWCHVRMLSAYAKKIRQRADIAKTLIHGKLNVTGISFCEEVDLIEGRWPIHVTWFVPPDVWPIADNYSHGWKQIEPVPWSYLRDNRSPTKWGAWASLQGYYWSAEFQDGSWASTAILSWEDVDALTMSLLERLASV